VVDLINQTIGTILEQGANKQKQKSCHDEDEYNVAVINPRQLIIEPRFHLIYVSVWKRFTDQLTLQE
jgi:hypothetical protein